MDAVIIDPIELKVTIIQSKYERAGGTSQIDDNDLKLLSTVRHYFDTRNALNAAMANGNPAAKRLLTEAFDAIRKKGYSLELVFISTHKKAPHQDDLVSSTFGFRDEDFKIYDYNRMIQFYNDKSRDFTPSLGVYNLPFVDQDKTIIKTAGHRSWILTVKVDDIRALHIKHGLSLFRKNVRNFLGKSRTNKKISETLEKDADSFWYYNNGITILCDKASIIMEKGYIRIENPQVVNGCQTVMSIAKCQGELKGEVMVRVIESTDHNFINLLTLYQNSSNPVYNRDLRSNDPAQIRLKHELRRRGYYYENKRGQEYSTMVKTFPALKSEFNDKVIKNEDIAKLLATVKISPAVALSGGSDKFFGDYYDRIFTSDLSSTDCLALDILYRLVEDSYKGKTKKFHIFEKDWVFKRRAIYYVVNFLHKVICRDDIQKKKFVSSYENNDWDTWYKFEDSMLSSINKYFDYVYGAWAQSTVEYYNTYLQDSKTLSAIQNKYGTGIGILKGMVTSKVEKVLA